MPRSSNLTFVRSVSASGIVHVNYSLQVGDQSHYKTCSKTLDSCFYQSAKLACREPSRLHGAQEAPHLKLYMRRRPFKTWGTGGNDIQADILSSWKGDKGKQSRAICVTAIWRNSPATWNPNCPRMEERRRRTRGKDAPKPPGARAAPG